MKLQWDLMKIKNNQEIIVNMLVWKIYPYLPNILIPERKVCTFAAAIIPKLLCNAE